MSELRTVCPLSAINEEGAYQVVVDDIPIAIVRSEGTVYAIKDVCSHGQVALSEGEVEKSTIECWMHGAQFDLRTGKALCLPATEPVPVYPVIVDDSAGDAVVRISLEELS